MRVLVYLIVVAILCYAGYYLYSNFIAQDEKLSQAGVSTGQNAPPVGGGAPKPISSDLQSKGKKKVETPETPKRLEETLKTSPNSEAMQLIVQAKAALVAGKRKEVEKHLKAVLRKFPSSHSAKEAAVMLAEFYNESGDMFLARNSYSFAFRRAHSLEEKQKIYKKIEALNEELIFSPTPSPDAVMHKVQPGDTLGKIAAKFNCPWLFIQKINNISDPKKLRVGQRVKVITGGAKKLQFHIVVSKKFHTVTIYLGENVLAFYRATLGKYSRTPVGEYQIINRQEKPSWQGYPPGHPKNILGNYWLGLDEKRVSGLGFHGTDSPDDIGKDVSQGCIRLLDKDLKQLYIMVPIGTKVTIEE